MSSGVVDLRLDAYTPKVQHAETPAAEPLSKGKPASALDILLDGVEARVRR